MLTVDEIRREFLEFFRSKQFSVVESSSLVPSDPTLLFANSGMVQFKKYFYGVEKPDCPRISTVQKCLRAGGKHNDLDNVGYTARHHTFFEMLGNFSFGDYFKREAITWAWEFLTETLNIPKEKLLVTVYHEDAETYSIWRNEIGLAPEKIIKISTKDNFWEMGDTGPCGPCSEIFYDHGEEIAGGPPGSANENGDRYTEIWNIVFTQYNRNEKGELEDLPSKNIDTGAGLERLAAVLQGVHSNYEIDLFQKIIDTSKKLFGGEENISAHRIIADHIRSSCFLICDGILPSNEGRGYVLRRIMRRAMLQLHRLGHSDLSLHRLVPCLVETMGSAYPELEEQREFIIDRVKNEGARFAATLENGMKLLEKKMLGAGGNMLSGPDVFKLYDTYGFPPDLTEIILATGGMTADIDGFNREMEKQRERARASWIGSGDAAESGIHFESDLKTSFVGYGNTENEGRIIKIIKNGESVEEAQRDETIDLLVDNSCFFGENGGQVGDRGNILLKTPEGEIISNMEIENTTKSSSALIIHRGSVRIGKFRLGDLVSLRVDGARRAKITANHSATHLLQFALKSLLGKDVVNQRGSQVDAESLRFDFSCDQYLGGDLINSVEKIVNGIILENSETKIDTMNIQEARKIDAIALFNEKYGETVRVVRIGAKNKSSAASGPSDYYSTELCGGTHVDRTGDIGLFKIMGVESVAAGVRRIEACTGLAALDYVNKKLEIIDSLSGLLKVGPEKFLEKTEGLISDNKKLKTQLSSTEKNKLLATVFEERHIGNMLILFKNFSGSNASGRDIKQFLASQRNGRYNENALMAALYSEESGKNLIMLALSENLTKDHSAVDLLKKLGSNGGGVPGFAAGALGREIDIDSLVKIISEKTPSSGAPDNSR
ncbi:MAG: alanine--tRNA ligase [Rickettsiales bacterium]|jgi:alanyl-tRNA synthetase|nr:alanine--tRNA ligase [Rickettsiales bacterium]